MEKKIFTAPFEFKALGDTGNFEGYASVFGVQDSDGDVISRGAFAASLALFKERGKMPKMLWQHRPADLIGSWTEIREDETGLFVRGHFLTDVQRGKEAYVLAKAGELDAMSVGFNIPADGATPGTRGRLINEVDLWEISLVTWGANPAALLTDVKTIKEFERFLRDAGFSRKQATAIASRGYKAADGPGDPGDGGEEKAVLAALAELTQKIRG